MPERVCAGTRDQLHAPRAARRAASVALTCALNHECTFAYPRHAIITSHYEISEQICECEQIHRVEIKDKYSRHAISPGNMTVALPGAFNAMDFEQINLAERAFYRKKQKKLPLCTYTRASDEFMPRAADKY